MLLVHLTDQLFCLFDIGAITDSYHQVYPALFLGSNIYNRAIGNLAIWDRNLFVIDRNDGGVSQADTLYRSLVSAAHNVVMHAKRTQQQQQDSACHIRQAALQGKANSQSGRTQKRDDGSRRDTDLIGRDKDCQRVNAGICHRDQETADTRIQIHACKGLI